MLNKKGFTLVEMLFSMALVSIIYASFPIMMDMFIKATFQEEKNWENLGSLINDTKVSYSVSSSIVITPTQLEIIRKDNCHIFVTYDSVNKTISKTFTCDAGFANIERTYKIGKIDNFLVEETGNILKMTYSSTLEPFNRWHYFYK